MAHPRWDTLLSRFGRRGSALRHLCRSRRQDTGSAILFRIGGRDRISSHLRIFQRRFLCETEVWLLRETGSPDFASLCGFDCTECLSTGVLFQSLRASALGLDHGQPIPSPGFFRKTTPYQSRPVDAVAGGVLLYPDAADRASFAADVNGHRLSFGNGLRTCAFPEFAILFRFTLREQRLTAW